MSEVGGCSGVFPAEGLPEHDEGGVNELENVIARNVMMKQSRMAEIRINRSGLPRPKKARNDALSCTSIFCPCSFYPSPWPSSRGGEGK